MAMARSLDLVSPPRPRLGQRVRSHLFRAVGTVTTPLLPSDYLDLVDPLRNGADLRGRVLAVIPQTPHSVSVLIKPGWGWLGHVPGQYIRIGVDVAGVRLWRAYSVTSGPRRDGCIAITVKAIPDGVVSNHMVHQLKPGTVIQLDQAAGDFCLPRPRPERLLFVTAGSGITPVMGILRHLLGGLPAGSTQRPDIVVLHSAPTPDEVIFGAELRGLAAAGLLRLVERHTDRDGLLGVAELPGIVPDWTSRQTWACGPVGLLTALEGHWADGGLADRLHTERFRPHVVVTGDGGTVTFERSGRSAEADAATPILDAGEDAGVLMKSGCRMGICYGCVVKLTEGAVRDLRNGNLTTAIPGDPVAIQTCVNAAAGPCHIDA